MIVLKRRHINGVKVKNEEILDSWKDISRYLDRDMRTCHRWEKEHGLPVHRIDNTSSRSKVFAYKSEIDKWLKERACSSKTKKKSLLGKRWITIGIVSFLGFIAIILAFSYFTHRITFSPGSDHISIAVFPFENLNSSRYVEYFSEGMTNEIINNLTNLSWLRVIPARYAAVHPKTSKTINQMGQELKADYILKGKIEKNENKIWMFVQLIRTKDDKNVWNKEYDCKLADIFTVQENIHKKINEILNRGQELSSSSYYGKTHDYMAFDNYLKGNYILNRLNENNNDPWKLYHQGKYYSGQWTREGNELAINLFNQAIRIDSNFALAYIGLAYCYSNYVNYGWDFYEKWLDKAEYLIKKAQMIYPDLPEYYSALIEIYLLKELGFNENTKSAALELAQEGIKKYPDHLQLNSIVGYCYFLKFGEKGNEADYKKALEHKEKSFWLNPYSLNNIVYAEFLMLNKEFYKAVEVCTIIEKHDSSSLAKFRLGEVYYYSGDLDRSEAIFHQFDNAAIETKIGALYYLGMISSQRGEREKALKILEEIKRISPEEYIIDDYLKIASIHMGLGIEELGYKELSSFFDRPIAKNMSYVYLKYIDIDNNFDKFRESEDFRKFIKFKEKTHGRE